MARKMFRVARLISQSRGGLYIRLVEKSFGRKYNEQPNIAADGAEHTVDTADKRIFYRELISTPINFQRSPKNGMSLNKTN